MYSSLRRAGDRGTKGMDSSGCWRMEDKEELRGDMGAFPANGPKPLTLPLELPFIFTLSAGPSEAASEVIKNKTYSEDQI